MIMFCPIFILVDLNLPRREGLEGAPDDPESTVIGWRGCRRFDLMDDEPIRMRVSENLPELLLGPFRRRMIGNIEMQNSPRVDFHRHEHVQHLKVSRHRQEEIIGDDGVSVIPNESGPTLISSRTISMEILPDGSRRDSNTEFQIQFVRDPLFAHEGLSRAISRIRSHRFEGSGAGLVCATSISKTTETRGDAIL